jgi:hypothetical protein
MKLFTCKEGHDCELDLDSKEIVYKDNRVLVSDLVEAYDSGFDRVKLSPTLMFIRLQGFVEFGCLSMSEEQFIKLKKLVCYKLRKTILVK